MALLSLCPSCWLASVLARISCLKHVPELAKADSTVRCEQPRVPPQGTHSASRAGARAGIRPEEQALAGEGNRQTLPPVAAARRPVSSCGQTGDAGKDGSGTSRRRDAPFCRAALPGSGRPSDPAGPVVGRPQPPAPAPPNPPALAGQGAGATLWPARRAAQGPSRRPRAAMPQASMPARAAQQPGRTA